MAAKKIFISSDIEGTCGIAHWDETEIGKPDYVGFARQMTREVAAACEGAVAAGADDLLVKDAHGSARNIDHAALPTCAHILRGWTREPLMMMAGLDKSFDGAFFTGYHSPAGSNGNPLAHTMAGIYLLVTINGQVASELTINCLAAAWLGVPVLMVTGDEELCANVKAVHPAVYTVPVGRGIGNGTLSMHPDLAVARIRETAETAVKAAATDPAKFQYPLPKHFDIEVTYREHALALRNSFYPGAEKSGPRSVRYETADYGDALRFMLFCL